MKEKRSLLRSLTNRSINGFHVGDLRSGERSLYRFLVPNLTLVNVSSRSDSRSIRKFSPDGGFLFCSDSDRETGIDLLCVYRFLGCCQMNSALDKQFPASIDSALSFTPENGALQNDEVFDRYFKFEYQFSASTVFNGMPGSLSRELLIFSADSKRAIFAAFKPAAAAPYGNDSLRNSFALPATTGQLYDVVLLMFNVSSGEIYRDSMIRLSGERVTIAATQCVSWLNDRLAVLSVQHQTIYMYRVTESGRIQLLFDIGRFCCGVERAFYEETAPRPQPSDLTDLCMPALKNKMLIYLYQNAESCDKFHNQSSVYSDLKLMKLQLISDELMIIKMLSYQHLSPPAEASANSCHQGNCLPAAFILYNYRKCSVILVTDNTDQRFLSMFEKHSEIFQSSHFQGFSFHCSTSNNSYTREVYRRTHNTIKSNRYGSPQEATRRSLGHLPHPCQSATPLSPFFDTNLFSFDDKWLNLPASFPLSSSLYPIKFLNRSDGKFSFKLLTGRQSSLRPPAHPQERPLVGFINHPFEPFIISTHKTSSSLIVNFHVRYSRVACQSRDMEGCSGCGGSREEEAESPSPHQGGRIRLYVPNN